MKYLVVAHSLNFWKAHLNSKKFEKMHSTMQNNRLLA